MWLWLLNLAQKYTAQIAAVELSFNIILRLRSCWICQHNYWRGHKIPSRERIPGDDVFLYYSRFKFRFRLFKNIFNFFPLLSLWPPDDPKPRCGISLWLGVPSWQAHFDTQRNFKRCYTTWILNFITFSCKLFILIIRKTSIKIKVLRIVFLR